MEWDALAAGANAPERETASRIIEQAETDEAPLTQGDGPNGSPSAGAASPSDRFILPSQPGPFHRVRPEVSAATRVSRDEARSNTS